MKWLLRPTALMLFPAAALADPCEGRLPSRQGETFSGRVRYVGFGDSLLQRFLVRPATWLEVRLRTSTRPN